MRAANDPTFGFNELDDVAHAFDRGFDVAGAGRRFQPKRIGPLVELWCTCRNGRMPSLAVLGFPPLRFLEELNAGRWRWVCPERRNHGFYCLGRTSNAEADRHEATKFLMDARDTARRRGYPLSSFDVLETAAYAWLDNAHEHSQAVRTGLLAFALDSDGGAEVVVADAGEGLLASLHRNEYGLYQNVASSADALRTALKDGESRFKGSPLIDGRQQRGLGFGQLFRRLATLESAVRFRSGDSVLRHNGSGFRLDGADVLPTVDFKGLLAWVRIAPSRSVV